MDVLAMSAHVIDLHRLTVYEAGAVLISLLAFPGDSEEEIRAAAHASLCHHALRAVCEFTPDWALHPQAIKPLYALRTSQEVRKDLRTLRRRLRDRMAAGRMAIGFLKFAISDPTTKPAERVSINQMARLVLEDTRQTDPDNVETRVWRASLPVFISRVLFSSSYSSLRQPLAGWVSRPSCSTDGLSKLWSRPLSTTPRSSPRRRVWQSIRRG
jgi:hypothetical protein